MSTQNQAPTACRLGTQAPPHRENGRGHDTEGLEPSMPDADYCEIQVGGHRANSRRAVALVDVADAEMVGAYRWSISDQGYARRNAQAGGKQLAVRMHRFLLGLCPGDPREVDHVNGDRLDNRRVNLRVCSRAQNGQNRLDGPYRGASWDAGTKRWRAHAMLDFKYHYLGLFATQEEAAAVAAAFRREHMPFSADARAGELA